MKMTLLFATFWKGMLMDIKFAHISSALAKLRDEIGSEALKDAKLQVSVAEDDPGSGKMIECLTLTCALVKPPTSYDSFKTDTNCAYTLEIFADSDNRPPRLTISQSRDLEKKEQ
jgi:hypothetical protein